MSKNRSSKTPVKREDKSSKSSKLSNSSGPEMKTSEIRDLIDFISKTGLNEVNIETKELKLHVKREPDQKILKSQAPMMASPAGSQVMASAPQQQLAAQSQPHSKTENTEVPAGKKTVDIKSPMIGTFYRSSNPDSPPFVSVGDKVSKGQTVCIIEAMKLFNEIESEVSGTIVKALLENANPVEYDQVLFVVEPD
jgi:acetyl-CoA carboxylase biotin carboxyl carrier protein